MEAGTGEPACSREPARSRLETAREIVRRLPRLSTVPQAAARASQVAQDPDSSVEELAEAFAGDPALCSHLLKVANSAYYGVQAEVRTIDRAAVLLGRNVLRNVAVAASMRAIVRKLDGDRSIENLWKHSLYAAAAASKLAELTRAWEPAEAFAAGLVHDLGILVELETDARRAAGGNRPDALAEELEANGTSHREFGQALCEAWGFPETLRDVTAHHHEPLGLEGPTRTLAAIVHVAEILGSTHEHGCPDIDERRTVDDAASLELLGLDGADLEEVRAELRAAAEEVERSYA